jgi:hypothetical protein
MGGLDGRSYRMHNLATGLRQRQTKFEALTRRRIMTME